MEGSSRVLDEARSLPLAVVDDLERPEAEVVLPPGPTLLLYTDGLIERRDQVLDEGMARAVEVLSGGRDLAPPELAELLTECLLADAPDDDVAFLLYRCGS
jgi:serine phosphatase RsbU (regulator of sigma subunit)